jgi:hypothetical protein
MHCPVLHHQNLLVASAAAPSNSLVCPTRCFDYRSTLCNSSSRIKRSHALLQKTFSIIRTKFFPQVAGRKSQVASLFAPHALYAGCRSQCVLCDSLLVARGRCSSVHVDHCTCWFTVMAVERVPLVSETCRTQSDIASRRPVQLLSFVRSPSLIGRGHLRT